MGTIGSVVALAMVSAPVVGGTIFQRFGFEAVFWTLGAFLIIDVILRLMMIEWKDVKKWDMGDLELESEVEESGSMVLLHSAPGKSMLATVLVNFITIFAKASLRDL